MPYLTCTMISSVDLAHYGVFHAKDWVSVDCGTKPRYTFCHGLCNWQTIKRRWQACSDAGADLHLSWSQGQVIHVHFFITLS